METELGGVDEDLDNLSYDFNNDFPKGEAEPEVKQLDSPDQKSL
jgi:hypothetical protein